MKLLLIILALALLSGCADTGGYYTRHGAPDLDFGASVPVRCAYPPVMARRLRLPPGSREWAISRAYCLSLGGEPL